MELFSTLGAGLGLAEFGSRKATASARTYAVVSSVEMVTEAGCFFEKGKVPTLKKQPRMGAGFD